jgi:hypothetical protein
VLSLLCLTQYFVNEVIRGRHGLGNYQLRLELNDAYEGQSDTTIIQPIVSPEDIVSRIRENLAVVSGQSANDDGEEPVAEVTDCTVNERAAEVIQREAISLNVKLSTFVVSGSVEPRVVRLFPKATCSCPAVGACYHILVARRAIGLHVDQKRSTSHQLDTVEKE